MSNKWNSDLTPEQNYILKEEGTEPPGSSHLNQRYGYNYIRFITFKSIPIWFILNSIKMM